MHYFVDHINHRIDLFFDGIPSEEIREFLKSDGWHWNRTRKCWYSFAAQQNIDTAVLLGARELQNRNTTSRMNASDYTVTRSYILPILYAYPTKIDDIRKRPVSSSEYASLGMTEQEITSYFALLHNVYRNAKQSLADDVIPAILMPLVDFCIAHRLLRTRPSDVSAGCLHEIAELPFDEFRLELERILSGIAPWVQFMYLTFHVGVIHYEWWQLQWWPTDETFVHPDQSNAPLSRTELQTLEKKLFIADLSGRFRSISHELFDLEHLYQMIIWNMEAADAQPITDNTLYIHKGRIICQTRNHRVNQVNVVFTGLDGADIQMNASYCTECCRFFMHYQTYLQYRRRYGVVLGDIKMLSGEDYNHIQVLYADESTLHLCGYNVSESNGLSADDRKLILLYILDMGIETKDKVIQHLEWLIETNQNRHQMDRAVQKWRDDLLFVLSYQSERQRYQRIEFIHRYNPQLRFDR